MEKRRVLIVLILTTFFLASALFIYSASKTQLSMNNGDKINVIVSIPPEAEFVEKVGGNKVKVTTMVPTGANPHTYEPLPEQLKEVSTARIYFQIGSGLEFENIWMDKLKDINKNMVIVNCSNGITFIPNQESSEDEHHGESQYDTHVWVSPQNAKIMVENIYQSLVKADPANEGYYRLNKDKYIAELDSSDKSINESLQKGNSRKILVYHPAWGYFCRDYGLTQISIEKDGKEPTPQGIASIIEQAKKENIKVIFVSPQYNSNSARAIASEIGGQIVTIDDLDKNYLSNLNNVAEAFKNALNS
ncbi:metal ABC transporter solute-binding protein, Zn/Mn family [Methanobacterium sp. ACI-7]|uniref:metal ABC transporter solute-binding protein, Zn/Mn family n=1 Tax=unclassified Methanobacterium TaxID=2627676 RepID=UPI0039C21657